jgi:hypothetical protein
MSRKYLRFRSRRAVLLSFFVIGGANDQKKSPDSRPICGHCRSRPGPDASSRGYTGYWQYYDVPMDSGEDLYSDTLFITNTAESQGQFTDDFTFDSVNTFPGQNNVPILTVIVNYVGLPPSVSLHDPGGEPFGLSSVVDGTTTIRDAIRPGNGYYVEVTGAPPVSSRVKYPHSI